MIVRSALLDTDIVSAILRADSRLVSDARAYFSTHGRFTFSIITRFEILRGLKARKATSLLRNFEQICAENDVLPITDAIIVQAADIYAELYRRGTLIGDADILIAATALEHGLDVITNNE